MSIHAAATIPKPYRIPSEKQGLPMSDASTASRDLTLLAPKFRAAVEAAIAECAAAGLPVKVAEALRSQERQAYLYAQGRTRPGAKVTNAPTNLTSWHGYGLAVDVIHATLGYNPPSPATWFRQVAAIFKKHGCSWGGDWSKPDMPHMQWGNMPASPAANHKALKQQMSNAAVWRAVGAADADFHNSESPNQPAAPPAHPLLKLGARGGSVHELQERLGIAADGIFGSATEAAVKALQSRKGLAPDGIVGPRTWAALA